jgi:hypothetical protein
MKRPPPGSSQGTPRRAHPCGVTVYVLVRLLGPQLYDHSISRMASAQMANTIGPTTSDNSVDPIR